MPSAPTPFRALGRLDIRVLHLHPGQRDGPLAGWLQHTTWVDPPQYEALSYEWGSPEKTRTITLEGGFEFQITQSLYDALCDLRQDASPGKPRTLWADAICINQEDLGELQNQVSIMATIYRKAARVVTYIGPERDDSTSAITFARELKARVDKSHDRSFPRVDFTLPPLDDYRWVGLKALILRTWASRCWCAQEFLLNGNLLLMCGTTRIPDWYLISDIVQHVFNRTLPTSLLPTPKEDPHSLRECIKSLELLRSLVRGGRYNLRNIGRGGRYGISLHWLLCLSHPFKATDPRDKVYSVLSLADDRDDLGLEVDYTCTAEHLYTTTATKLVQAKPTVDILYSCLYVKSLALPSWVPDWSHWQFGSHGATLDRGYCASESTVPEVRVEGTKLQVAGCLVDEIVYVGEPIGQHYAHLERGIPERKAWLLEEYAGVCRQLGVEPYPGDEDVVDAFWRTLIGNITLYEETAEANCQALYNAHLEYDGEGSSTETTAMAREYCDAVRRRSRYRRLAVTKKGYIGAVPMTAETGDWVSMFQGATLLFTVRPKGPDYTYFGHAYVHGLMSGKVLEMESYRKKTIVLV